MDRETYERKMNKLKDQVDDWFDRNFDDDSIEGSSKFDKVVSWLKQKKDIVESEAREQAENLEVTFDKLEDRFEEFADKTEDEWDTFAADVSTKFKEFKSRFDS